MKNLLAVLPAVLALAAQVGTEANSPRDGKPHVVVFISDDHGYDDSSLAGHDEFATPNLSRIARDGMTFTHAFAASPSCAPSRAALLTGMMPMRSGAMLNHQPPREDVKKLPAYLQSLGYEVVAFGKVAHYKQGKLYGFDHVSHDGFHDERCVAAAIEYLENCNSKSPLCLLVGTNWPHVPWPDVPDGDDVDRFKPPPTHVDTPATREWRARYAAAVARFDEDLGAVYDAAYHRLGRNTLFLHFSDHGAQWPCGKWNLYDAGTRVPFVAVWPEVIEPDSHSDAMITLVDVLPTLVEVAGGNPPKGLDGTSFQAVLRGSRASHRDVVFATHSGDGRMNAYPKRSVRTREWKYIRNLRSESQHTTHIDRGEPIDGNSYWRSWMEKAQIDPQAAAIVERYHHRPAEELYNLENDALEQYNVAADSKNAAVLAELRAQLDEWMREQGDQGLATEAAVAEAFSSQPRGEADGSRTTTRP